MRMFRRWHGERFDKIFNQGHTIPIGRWLIGNDFVFMYDDDPQRMYEVRRNHLKKIKNKEKVRKWFQRQDIDRFESRNEKYCGIVRERAGWKTTFVQRGKWLWENFARAESVIIENEILEKFIGKFMDDVLTWKKYNCFSLISPRGHLSN